MQKSDRISPETTAALLKVPATEIRRLSGNLFSADLNFQATRALCIFSPFSRRPKNFLIRMSLRATCASRRKSAIRSFTFSTLCCLGISVERASDPRSREEHPRENLERSHVLRDRGCAVARKASAGEHMRRSFFLPSSRSSRLI